MSYDLMVFDADQAPRKPSAFAEWYDQVTRWDEGHDYDDPTNTSPALQAWYWDMIRTFPPMNGPNAPRDQASLSDPKVTDYACAAHAIYAAFSWQMVDLAYHSVVD